MYDIMLTYPLARPPIDPWPSRSISREHGLPLAKALDEEGRLRVVDGDMEPHQVEMMMIKMVEKIMEIIASLIKGLNLWQLSGYWWLKKGFEQRNKSNGERNDI